MTTTMRWLLFLLSQICWFWVFTLTEDATLWLGLGLLGCGFTAYLTATRASNGPFAYQYSLGEGPEPPLDILVAMMPPFFIAWFSGQIPWMEALGL